MPNDGRKQTRWLDIEIDLMGEILDVVGNDGHSILYTAYCKKLGIPTCICKRLERKFKSDTSDPKSTIFVGGKAVRSLTGIHTLDLLGDMAKELPIAAETVDKAYRFHGRGSTAQELTTLIRDVLEMKTESLEAMVGR